MSDEKVQELLLKLIEDVATINAKLDSINEQRLASRLDLIEAQTREQDRIIKTLEKRTDAIEKHTRDSMVNNVNTQRNIFISAGLAIFGALVSLFINLL